MRILSAITLCVSAALLCGCSSESQTATSAFAKTAETVDGSKFLLSEEPEGAANVIEAREKSADGDEITLVGRIGGSENPWVDGRAVFSIVDNSLKACNDLHGDSCPKPWDYCCENDKLPSATALIKVVDAEGSIVKADAQSLLGVKELSTVVVKGKARRDEGGNLTVLTSSVFVKQN